MTLANQVIEAPEGAAWYVQLAFLVVGTIVTGFLIPCLRQLTRSLSERAEQAKEDREQGKISRKQELLAKIEEEGAVILRNLVRREYPNIARRVKDGKLKNHEDVKAAVERVLDRTKTDVAQSLGDQGFDMLQEFGERTVDNLIDGLEDRVGPFPGRDSVAALLRGSVSDMLIEQGIDAVRNYLEGGDTDAAVNGDETHNSEGSKRR